MAEDQESSEDKLSKLKLKLKKMGVMQDSNASPEHKSKPFWRGKLPILLVVTFAIGFFWWISRNDLTLSDTAAHNQLASSDNPASVQPSLYSSQADFRANPIYPPPPPGWNRAPLYNSMHRAMDPAAGPGRSGYSNRNYGPPPGWQPYRGYPPPPPAFYGRPYYYGPPPGFFRNPGYHGYNSPPP